MNALLADLKTLYHLAVKPNRGADHAERMESFYSGQADDYDRFRDRLLQGRRELFEAVTFPEGGVLVDLGGGTGGNLEFLGARLKTLSRAYVVDLAASLLSRAQSRIQANGWQNVHVVCADAIQFMPPTPVDVVTFSYSLTMIPDWFAAIDNAIRMLRPGGLIAVVDFYVSRKNPPADRRRHSALRRGFWPLWFQCDDVHLSPDHVPYLHDRFKQLLFEEHLASIPYFPIGRVPYYLFVGEKR